MPFFGLNKKVVRHERREGTEAELQSNGSVKFGDHKMSANQWALRGNTFGPKASSISFYRVYGIANYPQLKSTE